MRAIITSITETAMNRLHRWFVWIVVDLLAMVGGAQAHAAGKLGVVDAWIRLAPPGAGMLAGYATLSNTGDAPITVLTVQSNAFRMASLHETIVDKGVAKMRDIHRLVIAPGATTTLEPGGKHLMLMQPRHDIVAGEKVEVMFLLDDGTRVETHFDVPVADPEK